MKNNVHRLFFIALLSAFTGLIVALFLFFLDLFTTIRFHNPWLLYTLPLSGIAIFFLYTSFGKSASQGNNLIIEEVHAPNAGVPARMGPFILLTTLLTHLSGGSAGREGTAVQMGASLFASISKWMTISRRERKLFLLCGMAAGFGAVFGTPFAGAVFAIEVLTRGKIRLRAFLPCLLASIIGHFICIATGIHHTRYAVLMPATFREAINNVIEQPSILFGSLLAAALFGVIAFLFITFTHHIHRLCAKHIKPGWLLPVAGAAMLIVLTLIIGTRDYLGIGVTEPTGQGISITNAFILNDPSMLGWWWKLLFTAITLGTGFKGGEVTPLFFIGAMAGNAIATIIGLPLDLFAALGFIGVFAAASKAPVTSILIGVELFGAEYAPLYSLVCYIACASSGSASIYSAQRRR